MLLHSPPPRESEGWEVWPAMLVVLVVRTGSGTAHHLANTVVTAPARGTAPGPATTGAQFQGGSTYLQSVHDIWSCLMLKKMILPCSRYTLTFPRRQ